MRRQPLAHRLFLVMLLAIGTNPAAFAQLSSGQGERAHSSTSARRQELLDTLDRLVDLRHKVNPHGYEKDLSFTGEFYSARARIARLLESPPILSNETSDVISSLLREYEVNHAEFVAFVANNPANDGMDPKLAAMSPPDIAADILTLFLIVNARDPDLAEFLKKSSYIWPFCRTRDQVASTPEVGISAYQLLAVVQNLRKSDFSTSYIIETVQHERILRSLSLDDLARWRKLGIPQEIINAASAARPVKAPSSSSPP